MRPQSRLQSLPRLSSSLIGPSLLVILRARMPVLPFRDRGQRPPTSHLNADYGLVRSKKIVHSTLSQCVTRCVCFVCMAALAGPTPYCGLVADMDRMWDRCFVASFRRFAWGSTHADGDRVLVTLVDVYVWGPRNKTKHSRALFFPFSFFPR